MGGNDGNQMLIVTELEETPFSVRRERGIGEIKKGILKSVGLSDLKNNMKLFFDQINEVLDMGRERIGAFEVDKIEVSAQITGEGKVCLMGSGATCRSWRGF